MSFIDRELSWLGFNTRVAHQATRSSVPIMERLKFLGITFSNLNEFISVRFAYIVDAYARNNKVLDDLGKVINSDKYEKIYKRIIKFKEKQYGIYKELKKELIKEYDIHLIDDINELKKKEEDGIKEFFLENILPLLTPIAYDTTKEPPIFNDKDINILVSLKDKKEKNVLCVLSIPNTIPRIYKLSGDRYLFTEEIVMKYLPYIFRGKKITDSIMFKTYKNLSLDMESDDNEYILDRMEKYLSNRDMDNANIFLDIRDNKNSELTKILCKLLDVYKGHVFKTKKPLGLECLSRNFMFNGKFQYDPFKPYVPKDLVGSDSVMTYIAKEDLVLHHPFETYDVVIDFIKEASVNPDVLSIKQTLYRVSSKDSPIIDALCKASKNGKNVSVLLELKARFDEKQNIDLVTRLKESGCNIVYGVEELKVHGKFCVVAKKTRKGIKLFSHIATGNYNEVTSRIYTDISYLTSRTKIGNELNNIFNAMSGFSDFGKHEALSVSPVGIREKLISCIDNEIRNVKKGGTGFIVLKTNSLCDKKIIDKLYEAGKKGVNIKIICRGICSIVANENIEIRSVVGRFLEHSRIYYFHNKGNNNTYISSADLMTRNLDKRVEILVELKDEQSIRVRSILSNYLKDDYNTYIMNSEGVYVKIDVKKGFDVHNVFITAGEKAYKLPKSKKVKK